MIKAFAWVGLVLLLLAGCVRPYPEIDVPPLEVSENEPAPTPAATPVPIVVQLGTAVPAYNGNPTPDPDHPTGTVGSTLITHEVAEGETLGAIAIDYDISVEELIALNEIENADFVFAGQILSVPGPPGENLFGPSFKIIPDSELVYGPAAKDFDIRSFVTPQKGYLTTYTEEVEGQKMDGPQIIQLIADRYSVNPRLLLAALEHHSGWVTQTNVANTIYPLGHQNTERKGLYRQLNWAANLLNLGYYGRSEGGLRTFFINDGSEVAYAASINDGTAGVQLYLGAVDGAALKKWQHEAGPDGFYATYFRLFDNPFAYSVDPLLPQGIAQPALTLPWSVGETWHFSGGPHGAWNTGSAWAALDFIPPGEQFGCYTADEWVTAVADGVIARSGAGQVVLDLDGDGFEGTGWAVTYLHLADEGRIAEGTAVQSGAVLGHPSCEGGVTTGAHVHIARAYNGHWISADGDSPFNLGGWISQGAGYEYNGWLARNGISIEADAVRSEDNGITAGG